MADLTRYKREPKEPAAPPRSTATVDRPALERLLTSEAPVFTPGAGMTPGALAARLVDQTDFAFLYGLIGGVETRVTALDAGGLGGPSAILLRQLADVAIVNPAPGNVLTYDGGSAAWVNSPGVLANTSNIYTALQSFRVNDTNAAGISYPAGLQHTVSNGVGQTGIGVGLNFQVEDGVTEGAIDTVGRLQAYATQLGAGVTNSAFDFKLWDTAAEITAMTIRNRRVLVQMPVNAIADYGMLSIGPGGFASGGTNFTGHTSGTLYAANADAGFQGDLLDLQQQGVCRMQVRFDGRVGIGTNPVSANPTAMLHVTRPAAATPNANIATMLKVVGAADTLVPSDTFTEDVLIDLARTLQLAAGAATAASAVRITAPTYSAPSGRTLTTAATLKIDAAPVAGTNITLTDSYGLWVASRVRVDGDGTYVFQLPADATVPTTVVGRIPIKVGGTLRYLAYYS